MHCCTIGKGRIFLLLWVCTAPILAQADLTLPDIPLSSTEMKKVTQLMGERFPWFSLSYGGVVQGVRSSRSKKILKLYSKYTEGKYCRIVSRQVIVNKSMTKLLDVEGIEYYVAENTGRGCDTLHLNYIATSWHLVPDFVVEYFLAQESSILSAPELQEAAKGKGNLVLRSFHFATLKDSSVVRMEWKSENSNFTLLAYLDVVDDKVVVLRFGAGETI